MPFRRILLRGRRSDDGGRRQRLRDRRWRAHAGAAQGAGAAGCEPRRTGLAEQRPLCHPQDGQTVCVSSPSTAMLLPVLHIYIIICSSIFVQKLKTRVIRRNTNPIWNEELTLSVEDPALPVRLEVYDKDTFSLDDPMGNAEFDICPFVEAVRMNLQGVPNGTMIRKVAPSRQNCLADESAIYWSDGKVLQDLVLRLKDVERGEVELQLQWVSIPGASGL
ncbi:hypothetical protein C4D60_Mb10t04360 [Musa balbisiana]|uniref:C2 domain-containing protein n=1 Tax=Musa balbisiana TaxID=52838 RepID=A0A4S8IUQ0_MUSBA|nr:hypothetical protein C4D60_Mb10t04360 [Musa balbisiana]